MTTKYNNMVLTETVQEKDLGGWTSNKCEKQVIAASQQAMVVLCSIETIYSL